MRNTLILLATFLLLGSNLFSQVTVGSSLAPLEGSLLDLKEQDGTGGGATSTKGLLLPRVKLTTLTPVTGKLSESIDNTGTWDENVHIGLLVYNADVNTNACVSSQVSGVYSWSGSEWAPIVLSYNIPTYDTSLATGTDIYPGANSYVMTPESTISIDISRATQIWAAYAGSTVNTGKVLPSIPGSASVASIVWQKASDGTSSDVISSSTLPSSTTLTVNAGTNTGNALISVSTSSGDVIWQWHIWVTPSDFLDTPNYYNNGQEYWFMDRLLGASSNADTGLYYQWGRSTPLTAGVSTVASSSSEQTNLLNAIQESGFILYNSSSSYDWYSSTASQWNDRWGDQNTVSTTVKSAFDPCPEGWRVPSFKNSVSPWSCLSLPSGSFSSGWTFSNATYNLGFYPANGYLANGDGSVGDVGVVGYEWTASASDYMAYFLKFTSTSLNVDRQYNRANAMGVRCVKDVN